MRSWRGSELHRDGELDLRLGNPEWRDNWTVGSGLRMEVIDQLGQVWLCQEPVAVEQAHGLALPDFGDGTFATPAWTGSAPIGDVDLPNDWTVRTVELDADLVAVIPNPATVVMVDGSGFHGPVPISRTRRSERT